VAEMNYLDIVPNLINYINLVFKQSNWLVFIKKIIKSHKNKEIWAD
jgi:hypothetical protein